MSNLEVVKSVPPFLVIFIPPLTLASVRGEQGQMRAANTLLHQAIELAQQLGDHGREVSYRMNQIAHIGFSGHTSEISRELATMRALLPDLPEEVELHVRRMMLAVEVYLPDADLPALATEARDLQEAGHSMGDLTLTLYSMLYAGRIALLETGLRYAQGRTPHARRAARQALQLSARRNNPWELVELLLSASEDLRMGQSEGLGALLLIIATDENVHFEQRGRAWNQLGNAGSAPHADGHSPLDTRLLRVWLDDHLRET